MQRIISFQYIFTICLLGLLYSCSSEELNEVVSDEIETSNPDFDIPPNIIRTPCDFNLSEIQANETKVINCVLDLDGRTVNLPENVTLVFDKGDITNGTLIFASGGKIAGELLSSELVLEGDVQLIDPVFKFFASRWDIVEGTTTTEIALDNNKNLESLFTYIKGLGGTTFQINKFDAFFEITRITPPEVFFRTSDEAINIPSDFTIEMTENTFFRVFPAEEDKKNGAIFAFNDVDNASIIGPGNLVGDRDIRAYSSGDVGETGSHLIHVQSGSKRWYYDLF